jgi:hypothetical protein
VPKPYGYEALIRADLLDRAHDPDAVQIKSITPPKVFAWGGGFLTPREEAWVSCVTWNGKNRYGAYVGFSTDAYLIAEGKIVDVIEEGGSRPGAVNSNFCPTSAQ